MLLQKCHRHKFHLEAIKFQTVDKKVLLRCISSEAYKQQNKMNAGKEVERGEKTRSTQAKRFRLHIIQIITHLKG